MSASKGVPETLRGLKVPIDGLRPYARNPRNGDTDVIRESLEIHGQYRPIVVRTGTNEILAGNHTYAAAMELGWKQIAATFVDCTDDEAARIVLVDNRSSDQAKYDNGLLASLLQDLPDLVGTGYDDDDLAKLLDRNDVQAEGGVGLGTPVVQYQIVFDDEAQQETWFSFLKYLKLTHPEMDTIGERVARHCVLVLEDADGR